MAINNISISPKLLLSLIEDKRYGVEYQPILSLHTLDIFAYEALSRFYDGDGNPVAPNLVYTALHHNPLSLFQVELAQKKLQLKHAPKGCKLFVNLDQDSYFAYGEDSIQNEDYTENQFPSATAAELNPFIKLFLQHQDNELTIELIENSEINDAKMSIKMIQLLASHNIKTALDDICNEHSMISTTVLEQVDFMKLDRFVVLNRKNSAFLILIRALVEYAHASGKKTILEGVETTEDLAFAKALNVDFVQGFLFKEQFLRFK